MIFRDGFYHADPHPGNLMFLPGAVVGVLDCGMVQRLHEELREDIEDALLALAQGDAEALTDSVWHLGTPPPTGRREPLMAELVEFVAEYTGQSLNELHLSAALTRLFDLLHRNHVFLPPGVALLLRTLVELEGTAQLLDPSFSLAEVIQPYYQKAIGNSSLRGVSRFGSNVVPATGIGCCRRSGICMTCCSACAPGRSACMWTTGAWIRWSTVSCWS